MYRRRGGHTLTSESTRAGSANQGIPATSSENVDIVEDDELMVPDARIKFERDLHTGKIITPCSMSREITTTFHRVPNITGFTWARTPDNVKKLYFEEFRKVYFWPDSWEKEVHTLWAKRAAIRFSSVIISLKKMRNANRGRPGYVPEEMWKGLLEHWKDPNVIKISDLARKARYSEPDGPGTGYSKNFGGSTSVAAKAQKLAKEKGVPISEVAYESFVVLHRKNGEFTYNRRADIAAKVNELAATQGENANKNDIFVNQVMGGCLDKKRRMVGTGNLGPSLVGSSSTHTTRGMSQQVDHQWHSEIEEKFNDERERIIKLEEEVKTLNEKMDQFMSHQQSHNSSYSVVQIRREDSEEL